MSDATRILNALEEGDPKAADELLPLVYEELRQLAAHKMAKEAPGQTLQATALVHEAFLRLVGNENQRWENSRHFLGAAAEAMRRILIENARKKRRLRRGSNLQRVDLEHVTIATEDPDEVVLAVHEALQRLAKRDPVKAEVVKLRYFIGMQNSDIAQILGLSEPTVKRYWAYARSWLYLELKNLMEI